MNTEVMNNVSNTVLDCLDRAGDLDAGSEARAREINNAEKLARALTEDYKVKEEIEDKHIRTENDQNNSKRELDIKEFQTEEEAEARKHVSKDVKWKLGGVAALILVERFIESKGQLVPKYFSKLWPKL